LRYRTIVSYGDVMTSFFCTLWGDKYSIDYVRNLHNAVKRNYDGEFKFYCQTDRELRIEGVHELPFGKYKPIMDGRFPDKPKLNFWEPNCWGISGRKVFLDLDVVILGNLNSIIELYSERPIINKSWWKEDQGVQIDHIAYSALTNGSIYVWEDTVSTKVIWEHINKYDKFIFFTCVAGSDNYLTTFHLDKFNFVPRDKVFSYHNEDPVKNAVLCTVETISDDKEIHQLNSWIKERWNG
jgi:hypothetical protein